MTKLFAEISPPDFPLAPFLQALRHKISKDDFRAPSRTTGLVALAFYGSALSFHFAAVYVSAILIQGGQALEANPISVFNFGFYVLYAGIVALYFLFISSLKIGSAGRLACYSAVAGFAFVDFMHDFLFMQGYGRF